MKLTWYGHACFMMESENGVRCEVRMEYDVFMSGQLAFSNDVRAVFRK